MAGPLDLATNPFAAATPPSNPAFAFDPSALQPVPAASAPLPTIGPGWMQPPPAQPGPVSSLPVQATPALPVPAAEPVQPVAAPPVAAPVKHSAKPAEPSLEQSITDAGKRQEAAIEKSQTAIAEGDDKLAQAYGDLRVQQQLDAQELKDKQKEAADKSQELDRQDAANLKQARDYTIPDFWQSSPGLRVASIVSVAMGNIAQGILGGPNGASDIINKYTDQYFQGQKQKVDNLYRYAEEQGKLDDRTRLRYAKELLDLKDQHAAVQQSILTHIAEVEKANGGNVARADTEKLKAQLAQDVLKSRGESRVQRGHILEMQSQTAKNYAEAEKARQEGNVAGTLKITERDERLKLAISGQIQQQLQKDPEAKHVLESLDKYVDAKAALDSGEGIGSKLTIDEITKAATGLGARPQSIHMFEGATGGSFSQILGAVQRLKSGDSLSPEQKANVSRFLDYTIKERKQKLGEVRTRLAAGMKQNPAYSSHPDIIEGALTQHLGDPAMGKPAQALPPGLPPGSEATGRKTKDGRDVYKLPNGQLVAG